MKDDRLIYLSFFGRSYPLCMTVLAHHQVEEMWGGLDSLSELLSDAGSNGLTAWCQLLRILMDGGASRVRALCWMDQQEAPELPEIPDLETLTQIIGWSDINAFSQTIMEAVGVSTKQTVEVAEEKNVETTQG